MTKTVVRVGVGSCGIAAGARPVFDRLSTVLAHQEDVALKPVGCVGLCFHEPLVEIERDGQRWLYGEMDADGAEQVVRDVLSTGVAPSEHLVYSTVAEAPENDMLGKQVRVVLRNCGIINPEKIEEYIARDGYKALEKAVHAMAPEQVIAVVTESGLRGRGGAGFPTGLKWKFAREAKGDFKYVVCNADEGDPGAFMDRSVLEGDPHTVIEGMVLCAYAVGASQGVVYCRAEYPLAIKHLNLALEQARERGYLGKNILGTNFSFDIYVKEGAGAFVCGEETALMASIEGKRGMPRPRPPSPPKVGSSPNPPTSTTWRPSPTCPGSSCTALKPSTVMASARAGAPRSSPWRAKSSKAVWWKFPWGCPFERSSLAWGAVSPTARPSRRYRWEVPRGDASPHRSWTPPWIMNP